MRQPAGRLPGRSRRTEATECWPREATPGELPPGGGGEGLPRLGQRMRALSLGAACVTACGGLGAMAAAAAARAGPGDGGAPRAEAGAIAPVVNLNNEVSHPSPCPLGWRSEQAVGEAWAEEAPAVLAETTALGRDRGTGRGGKWQSWAASCRSASGLERTRTSP